MSSILKSIGFLVLITFGVSAYLYYSHALPETAVDFIERTHDEEINLPQSSGKPSIVDSDLVYFDEPHEQDGVLTMIDFTKTEVVAPHRDDIQPLDSPVFVTAQSADKWLSDEEKVALFRGSRGTLVAYPLMMLRWHQVVTDDVDGVPLMITFDPLSGVLAAYDRRVDDREFHFGTTGKVFNGNSLLFDRETESIWQQINGKSVSGLLLNKQLPLLSVQMMEWGSVKDLYSEVQVLSKNSVIGNDYSVNPYGNYELIHDIYYKVARLNDLFHPKSLTIALSVSGNTSILRKIYLLQDLKKIGVVNERINGVSLVILYDYRTDSVDVFDRMRKSDDQSAGSYVFRLENGHITSREGEWNITADGLVLSNDDSEMVVLKRVPFEYSYWFSWMSFYPDSRVFTTRIEEDS